VQPNQPEACEKKASFRSAWEIRLKDAESTLLAEVDATMYRIASADTTWRQEEQEDVLA
jgi:hypothetical protein